MPIYPRMAASPGVASAATPDARLDPSGRQIQELGQQGERTAAILTEVKQKRDEFKDETDAQQRYQMAMLDLEGVNEELQKPANAEDAKAFYDKEVADRRPTWFEGLSPRAQLKLEQKLFPRTLEYKINAGRIENRALGDKYEAVGVDAKNRFIDAFARGSVTSFNADGSIVAGSDVDGKQTREYMEYADYIDKGVALGYKKPQEGEKEKEAAIATAAFYRANKLTQSDTEADLDQYLKNYKAESAAPGSTFLRNIDAGKRDDLAHRAATRKIELREKAEVEATKELKKQENTFVSAVVQSFADPDPTKRMSDDKIEAGLNRFATIMPRETVDAIMKLKTEAFREGGTTNWGVYHSLKIDILKQETPVTVGQIMRNVPDRLSAKNAEELIKLNDTSSAENAVEKTSYFKEGLKHITVLLGGTPIPGMEWMMKPGDQKRLSDGIFLFSQYARKVYASGDGVALAKLPEYARTLATNLKGAEAASGGGAQQPGDVPQSPSKPPKTGAKPAFDQ